MFLSPIYQYDNVWISMLQCLQPVLQCSSAICAIFVCLVKVEGNHKSLQEHATQNPEILGTKKNTTCFLLLSFESEGRLLGKYQASHK